MKLKVKAKLDKDFAPLALAVREKFGIALEPEIRGL